MRKSPYLLILAAFAASSCTPQARDKARRFFFEVPDETAGQSASADVSSNGPSDLPELHLPASLFVSVHTPYADQQCDACHSTAKRMNVSEKASDTCGECHEDFFDEDLVKHDPVSSGDCLMCHVPHRSRYPALLAQPVRDTCTDCHDMDDLSEDAHAGDASNCIACHDAHFGAEHLLRKDFVPAKKAETPE